MNPSTNFAGTGANSSSTTANLGRHSNIVDSGDNLGNSTTTQGLGRTGDGHFSGERQQHPSTGSGIHDSGLTGNNNTMGHNTGGYRGDNINTTHRAAGGGVPGEVSAHHGGGAGGGLGGGGYGSTHTAGSTSTSTGNYGPHDSNLANKVDPRVDSGTTGMGGYSNNNNNNVGFETTGNRAGGLGGTTKGHHARHGTSNPGVGVGGGGVGGVGTGGVHNQNPYSTNNGPHSSNLENKVDPRVDSDLNHRSNQHAQNPLSTNNGPHSSNLENKVDPRIDSDRDHRERTHHRENTSPESFGIAPNAAGGLTGGSMGSVAEGMTRDGRRLEGTVEGPIGGTTEGAHHESVEGEGVGGVGNNTNAGPHNSNVANKADPRVDSDMDHRQNYGPNNSNNIGGHNNNINTPQNQNAGGYNNNTTSTYSQGQNPLSTNNGPHSSNLENKADPRIDSDMDHRGQNYGHHNNNVNTGGYNNPGAAGSGAARQNPLSTNNGPHSNNLENKVDPRVDSDMDGRGIQHHQQQHNTAAAGGVGYNNTSGGVSGLNNNNNDGRGVHNNHHHSGNLDSSTPGHNGYNSHTTNPSAGHNHSNIANKVDQRVDPASGMHGRGTMGGSGEVL